MPPMNPQRTMTSLIFIFALSQTLSATCAAPANPIEAENCLPGVASNLWDVGGGDPSIQGFATDISVNVGGAIFFKVNTAAAAYRFDIYRIGYYGGLGARLVATVQPSVPLPQTQPTCINDPTTGLNDCGNWAVSGSWAVPANAVSGIYFANAVRTDTRGASHIYFIVRNDSRNSDILFKTSDSAWHAYNLYLGNSLYGGSPIGRAYKVSYNRPMLETSSTVFNSEYPMVRWLEANAYDVTYFTTVDAERSGGLILNHKLMLSVGHDEYWSGGERANVEAARAAGVNLAFFSGNEIFWKTRWENSIDGSGTPYRTLVCYKETEANAKIDPTSTWTGTWRDPRFSPPSDGGRPENALSGTIFMVNGPSAVGLTVPAEYGNLRFWRNTSIASLPAGSTATFVPGTLGFEWDVDLDNGFRPAGLIHLSSTTATVGTYLLDYGYNYGPGVATHNFTMYRHPSGALVFGAGDVQYSWSLDSNHWDTFNVQPVPPADPRIQQATVNLLADMHVQPATLQAGLVAASPSTDTTPPHSQITLPLPTAVEQIPVVITGTSVDSGGGYVGGTEISWDGGTTWHPTAGLSNWSYTWTPPSAGVYTLQTRATDDSLNTETPSDVVSITVGRGQITIWPPAAMPGTVATNDPQATELGVRFRSDVPAWVTGIRFYKSAQNTGTHLGNLWSNNGTLMAQASFTNESAKGWQQVDFSPPVAIAAGTTYVASYHTTAGYYSSDWAYFTKAGVDNAPLHALRDQADGFDGVYVYGTSAFPNQYSYGINYWVDVVVSTTLPTILAPVLTSISPSGVTVGASSFTLTANGANFTPNSLVEWNGSPLSTIYVSGTVLTSVVPASDIASSGIANISVYTAGAGTSASVPFSSTNPVPALVSISPGSATAGGASFTLTASGGNFVAGSVVEWNGSPLSTTYVSETELTAVVPASDIAFSGTANISVYTAGAGTSASVPFSSTNPVPALVSISPASATAGGSSFTLTASGGNFVAGSVVEWNGSPLSTTYVSGTVLTAVVPASDIASSGNANISVYSAGAVTSGSVSFKINAASGPALSIWSSTAIPVIPWINSSAVSLGVKFRSDVAGTISGIRFYKGAGNNGTHVGSLYSSTGTLLAQATFTGETASGWQQVTFSTPVSIAPNIIYVGALFTTSGFAYNPSYFTSAGADNPPLHALQSGVDGGNGVYVYGSAPLFPNQTYYDLNYWVDVVFESQ
jgi:hypothetical protein